MPKIPVYDPYQVQQQVRPGVRFEAPSGPGPGQIAGEQMQQFGQQVEQTGGEFSQMILEQQQRTNELRVLEQYNAAQREVLELGEEYRGFRGGQIHNSFGEDNEESIGFMEHFGGRLQEIITRNQDQLVAPEAKIRFNELTARLSLQTQDNLLRHYERENLVWEKGVVEDAVLVAAQAIAQNPTDNFGIGNALTTMRSAIEQQLITEGKTDPIARAERTRVIMSNSVKDIVLNLAADEENGGIEKAAVLFSILTASENEALTADDINVLKPIIEGGNAIVIGRSAARQIHDAIGWSNNQTVDVDKQLRDFRGEDGEPLTEKELDAARIELTLLRNSRQGQYDANQARLATEVSRHVLQYGPVSALNSNVFLQLDADTQLTMRNTLLNQNDAERRRENERLDENLAYHLYAVTNDEGQTMFERLADVTDAEINSLLNDVGVINHGKLMEMRADAQSAGASRYRGMTADLADIRSFAAQHATRLHSIMTYQGPDPSSLRLKGLVTDAIVSGVNQETERFEERTGRNPNVDELKTILFGVFNNTIQAVPEVNGQMFRVPTESVGGRTRESGRSAERGGVELPVGAFPFEQQLTAMSAEDESAAGAALARLERNADEGSPEAQRALREIHNYANQWKSQTGDDITNEQAYMALRRQHGNQGQ